jgi:hypothetical protein
MRDWLPMLAVSCALSGSGGELGYHECFRHFAATNRAPEPATCPHLADSNNTACKVTNRLAPASGGPGSAVAGSVPVLFSLQRLREQGEVAGVRLGKSMDEGVAAWGKPLKIWTRYQGLPRFAYAGANVIFEAETNRLGCLFLYGETLRHLRFEGGLSGQSSLDEWLAALGPPTRRSDRVGDSRTTVHYESGQTALTLTVDPVRHILRTMRIARPRRGS